MDLMQDIIARAKADKQRIVLPEGTEERTLKAADRLLADGVAGNSCRSEKSREESRVCRLAFPTSPKEGYDSREGCGFS